MPALNPAADDDADVDKVSCESFCDLMAVADIDTPGADGRRCWAAHLSAPRGVSSPQKRERHPRPSGCRCLHPCALDAAARAAVAVQEQRGARVSSETASAARLLSTVRPHRNVAPMRRMG